MSPSTIISIPDFMATEKTRGFFPEQRLIQLTFDFPSKVSNYDGNATSAKYLLITRLLRGILVSDGSSESFIVLESLDPFDKKFKTNTLYPISDIVEFIRNNKDYGF